MQFKPDCVMKTHAARLSLLLSVGAASLVAFGATAQTTAPAETPTPAAPASDAAPPKLPYGVDDVVKLTHAQVSEDVTLNFVHNSGTIYNLSPKDIVYLRDQGVSDKVINAMMEQRQNVPAENVNQIALQAQAAAATAAAQPPDPNAPLAAPVYVQPPPLAAAPPAPAPPPADYVPPSTLYVIPYGPAGGGYFGYPISYGSCYAPVSTVYVVGRSYVGRGYYGGGHYHGYHGSTVYHFGHH